MAVIRVIKSVSNGLNNQSRTKSLAPKMTRAVKTKCKNISEYQWPIVLENIFVYIVVVAEVSFCSEPEQSDGVSCPANQPRKKITYWCMLSKKCGWFIKINSLQRFFNSRNRCSTTSKYRIDTNLLQQKMKVLGTVEKKNTR